eukprot:566188-Pelagomonas_calceolata.AAC.7
MSRCRLSRAVNAADSRDGGRKDGSIKVQTVSQVAAAEQQQINAGGSVLQIIRFGRTQVEYRAVFAVEKGVLRGSAEGLCLIQTIQESAEGPGLIHTKLENRIAEGLGSIHTEAVSA